MTISNIRCFDPGAFFKKIGVHQVGFFSSSKIGVSIIILVVGLTSSVNGKHIEKGVVTAHYA